MKNKQIIVIAAVVLAILAFVCSCASNSPEGTYTPVCAYQVNAGERELVYPDTESLQIIGMNHAVFERGGTGYFDCTDGVKREFTWRDGILTSEEMEVTFQYRFDGEKLILVPEDYQNMPQYMEIHFEKE